MLRRQKEHGNVGGERDTTVQLQLQQRVRRGEGGKKRRARRRESTTPTTTSIERGKRRPLLLLPHLCSKPVIALLSTLRLYRSLAARQQEGSTNAAQWKGKLERRIKRACFRVSERENEKVREKRVFFFYFFHSLTSTGVFSVSSSSSSLSLSFSRDGSTPIGRIGTERLSSQRRLSRNVGLEGTKRERQTKVFRGATKKKKTEAIRCSFFRLAPSSALSLSFSLL